MISIIDYGLGNVAAFASAYEHLGMPYEIISEPESLKKPTHIILPGVGSFEGAMKKIHNSGFKDLLTHFVLNKKTKVLGICVGLQIMGRASEEAPNVNGLGWVDAETVKISITNYPEVTLKLPLMGWNKIIQQRDCPLLKGVVGHEFYFLHSYNIKIKSDESISSFVNYGEYLTASISSDNIFGTQFHPEKSHDQGLKLLQNFALL